VRITPKAAAASSRRESDAALAFARFGANHAKGGCRKRPPRK